jgi:hypothetical protein
MRPGSTGVGIGGMSERAREFGGQLKLTNAHPGTVVEVIIPRSVSVPADGPHGQGLPSIALGLSSKSYWGPDTSALGKS